jgi:hypothetical protein
LNVPRPVTVELDERGFPFAIGDEAEGDRRLVDEILEAWRINDEWWRQPITRQYVEVVLEGGGHMVLFEDLQTRQWFMQMP